MAAEDRDNVVSLDAHRQLRAKPPSPFAVHPGAANPLPIYFAFPDTGAGNYETHTFTIQTSATAPWKPPSLPPAV